MLRRARVIVPGVPHHSTRRGNNHQNMLFVDDGCRTCLRPPSYQVHTHAPEMTSYCLMAGHASRAVVLSPNDDA